MAIRWRSGLEKKKRPRQLGKFGVSEGGGGWWDWGRNLLSLQMGFPCPPKVEKTAMMASCNLLKELFHMPGSSTVVFSLRAFKKDLALPEMYGSLQSCKLMNPVISGDTRVEGFPTKARSIEKLDKPLGRSAVHQVAFHVASSSFLLATWHQASKKKKIYNTNQYKSITVLQYISYLFQLCHFLIGSIIQAVSPTFDIGSQSVDSGHRWHQVAQWCS